MAEWSNALPWKGSIWATVSGVRIPVSPPIKIEFFKIALEQSNFLPIPPI